MGINEVACILKQLFNRLCHLSLRCIAALKISHKLLHGLCNAIASLI